MNRNAYNASWASAASTYQPNIDQILLNDDWRKSSYDFCRLNDGTACSLFVVNSYGDQVFDKSLTEYIYLINDGSCSEQFVISESAFTELVDFPPTPVVENYYQCTYVSV